MSAWKGAAIGAGVLAVITGLLLGTGVVSIERRGGDADDAEGDDGADEEGDDGAHGGKKRRAKKRGKKKRGKSKKRDGNLDSLAYLNEVPITEADRGKRGVVLHEEGKTFDAYTLLNPCFRAPKLPRGNPIHEAQMWSIDGKMVHKWAAAPYDARKGWAIARLDDEGYLHYVMADTGYVKLDWESNIVWQLDGTFHHDFNFDNEGGSVVVMEQKRVVSLPSGEETRILDHGATFVSKDGKVEREVWLYDAFKDDPTYKEVLGKKAAKKERKSGDVMARSGGVDVFHANAVQVLPKDVEGLGKKGDLLMSARSLDTVFTISRETGAIVWKWGHGELVLQHDPTLTHDGKVVIFDNQPKRKRSRVVIVDPKTNEIARVYDGGDDEKFFSAGRGLVQGLPNGNILVFVSNEARILEIAPDDTKVWEFFGPWQKQNTRLSLRGNRVTGKALETAKGIVDGSIPPPKKSD